MLVAFVDVSLDTIAINVSLLVLPMYTSLYMARRGKAALRDR